MSLTENDKKSAFLWAFVGFFFAGVDQGYHIFWHLPENVCDIFFLQNYRAYKPTDHKSTPKYSMFFVSKMLWYSKIFFLKFVCVFFLRYSLFSCMLNNFCHTFFGGKNVPKIGKAEPNPKKVLKSCFSRSKFLKKFFKLKLLIAEKSVFLNWIFCCWNFCL